MPHACSSPPTPCCETSIPDFLPTQLCKIIRHCREGGDKLAKAMDRGTVAERKTEAAPKHQHSLQETARKKRTRLVMEEISKWGVKRTFLNLFLLWAPIVVYANILLPCWDCYDFEAAATHEVRR